MFNWKNVSLFMFFKFHYYIVPTRSFASWVKWTISKQVVLGMSLGFFFPIISGTILYCVIDFCVQQIWKPITMHTLKF